MLAAKYLGPHRISAVETENVKPRDGEAVLRVDGCGICGTDLYIASGKHPRAVPGLIVGHEFSGRIVEFGPGGSESTDLGVGDRVTCFPLITCGKCHACRSGNSHVCRSLGLYGIDREGGMAEYVRVPVSALIKLPDSLSRDAGALIEPLAVGVHAVERVPGPVTANDTAVVIGAGPIGLVTALALRDRGVERIFVTEPDDFRRDLARQLLFETLHPLEEDVVEVVRARTAGEGVDLVFEAAGSPTAARQMTDLVRPRGVIVNVSVFKEPVSIDMQAVNFKELEVVGTRVYTMDDYRTAIEVAQRGDLEKIMTHTFPLEEVSEAFELFRSGREVCKVIIDPVGGALRS